MDLVETLALVVGPFGGVIIGPLMALVLLVSGIRAHRRWPFWTGGALLVALAASIWVFWEAFWRGFAYVDTAAPAPIPSALLLVQNVALASAALTCLALVVAAILAVRLPRRTAVLRQNGPLSV